MTSVGCSVAYHLTKFGWPDVAIVERSVLTAGSSWHAAGGFHALNADPNIAALQAYTIDLLSEIEEESGVDIGLHMTGGISVASAPERWEWLQATYRVYQTMGIEDCSLMAPEEIEDKCPIIDVDGVYGGLWADREGYIDPSAVVHAYAKAARRWGADVIEHNRVVDLSFRPDGYWDIVTEKGTILAEHVVNAAGLWAREVGRMVTAEKLEQYRNRGSQANVFFAALMVATYRALRNFGLEHDYATHLCGEAGWKVYTRFAVMPKALARVRARDPQARLNFILRTYVRFPFTPASPPGAGRPGYEYLTPDRTSLRGWLRSLPTGHRWVTGAGGRGAGRSVRRGGAR